MGSDERDDPGENRNDSKASLEGAPEDIAETRLTPEKIATRQTQRLVEADEPTGSEGGIDPDATILTPQRGTPRRGAPSSQIEAGDRLANRYLILGTLGSGGMGIVYQARDEMLDLDVAIKVLRPDVAQDSDFLQRFRQELILARQVTHRHVVRIHDISEHEGLFFITMDFVRGQSLQDRLASEGALAVEEATRIGAEIADALAEAHRQGVVHRDLKPANILLDEEGHSYITDFGIARSLSHSGLTQTGEVLGTPAYLSPEQARGERVDSRSDLYTLGIMMAEMLSGQLPFEQGSVLEIIAQRMTGRVRTLSELGVEIPSALAAIVSRCLAKNPDRRYRHAADLAADLLDWKRAERRALWRKAGKVAGLAAAALATAGLISLGIDAFRSRPRTEPLAPRLATEITPRDALLALPFATLDEEAEIGDLSIALADLVTQSLATTRDLRVVDQVRVLQRRADLGLNQSSLEPFEIEKLAESLGAHLVLYGEILEQGGGLQAAMTLLDIEAESAKGEAFAPIVIESDRLPELAVEIAGLVLESLNLERTPPGPTRTVEAEALRLYAKGLSLLAIGESQAAAQALEQTTTTDATLASAWLRLSETYQALGRYDEALAAARETFSRSREATRSHSLSQARIAMLSGDPEGAADLLAQLVQSHPMDIEARVDLAEAQGQLGAFPEALAELETAAEIDPTDAELFFLRGRYSIQSGAMREAVDDLLVKALVLYTRQRNRPGQALIHNALGVGWQRLGMSDEARESYLKAAEIRRALGLLPGLAASLHNLALIDLERGELEAVEASLDEAMAIHEEAGNPEGIGFVANAYGLLEEERGDYNEALEYYKRALQVRRDLNDEASVAESYNNVGYSYYLLGDYDNAIVYLDRSLELSRKHGNQWGILTALQSLGSCRLDQGRWLRAQKDFEEALGIGRELDDPFAQTVSQLHLARIARMRGQYSAALGTYSKATEQLASVGDLRGTTEASLGTIATLLDLGDHEGARQRLVTLVEGFEGGGNQEQKAIALVLSGRCYLEGGEPDKAGPVLEQALAEAAASGSVAAELSVQIQLGRVLLASDKPKQARSELEVTDERAEKLGNASLRLETAEALAQATLSVGKQAEAEEILRRALRLADTDGSWARSFRLHELLARALDAQSNANAEAERRRTREELDRILAGLDPEHRSIFAKAHGLEETDAGEGLSVVD